MGQPFVLVCEVTGAFVLDSAAVLVLFGFVCLFLQTPSLGEQFKAHNPEWGILIFNSTVNPCIPPSHPVHVTQNTHHMRIPHTHYTTHTHTHTHPTHTQHIPSPHTYPPHTNHTGTCTHIHTHATCTYHTLHYTQHTHTTCTHMHSALASSGRSPGNLLSRVCLPRAFQPVPAVQDTHPTLCLCSLGEKSVILPPAAPRDPAT